MKMIFAICFLSFASDGEEESRRARRSLLPSIQHSRYDRQGRFPGSLLPSPSPLLHLPAEEEDRLRLRRDL